MAHATDNRRWLLAIPIAGIVIGFLWLALGPIFGTLSMFWLPMVIAVGVGAAMWKWGAERVLSLLGNKLVRGLAIFALLLALYVSLGQLGYNSLDFFAEFMDVTRLTAAVVLLTVALLLTPLPAVVLALFKPTGVPIDEKYLIQGSRGVAVIILTILLIRGWRVEGWKESISSSVRSGVEMVVPSSTSTVAASTTSSQTLILSGEEWTKVPIPPYHHFRFDAAEAIVVRNLREVEFRLEPDGKIVRLRDNVAVESFGRDIPGFTLWVRTRGEPTTATFSYWPCTTRPCTG